VLELSICEKIDFSYVFVECETVCTQLLRVGWRVNGHGLETGRKGACDGKTYSLKSKSIRIEVLAS
jgi:hypothetical protein